MGPDAAVQPEGELDAQSSPGVEEDDLTKAIRSLTQDGGAPLKTFEFTSEHSYPARDGGTMLVRADLGDILVETHDEPQVDIEAVMSIPAANRTEAEALMGKLDLSNDLPGNDLVEGQDACLVSAWGFVEFDPGTFSAEKKMRAGAKDNQISVGRALANNDQTKVTFHVKVPKNFNVEVFNGDGNLTLPKMKGNVSAVISDGNVTADDLTGHLTIKVEDGDLLFGDVTGDVNIEAEDGDVTIGVATGLVSVKVEDGEIKVGAAPGGVRLVSTEDGDIHLGEVAGEVQASTGDGKIVIGRIANLAAASAISTDSGGIRVGVSSEASLDVDARSSEGKVRGSLVDGSKARSVSIKLNGGGPKLTLRSDESSIQIDKVN